MWQANFASGNPKVVESVTQIPDKPMTHTDDLRTRERLEATHRSCPTFEMLMATLDALLLHLAPDVHDLRQDCGECWRGDRGFVGVATVGVTSVLSTACVKNVVAAAVSRVGLT